MTREQLIAIRDGFLADSLNEASWCGTGRMKSAARTGILTAVIGTGIGGGAALDQGQKAWIEAGEHVKAGERELTDKAISGVAGSTADVVHRPLKKRGRK